MNIESANIKKINETQVQNSKHNNSKEDLSTDFKNELKEASKNESKNTKVNQAEKKNESSTKDIEKNPEKNKSEQTLDNQKPVINNFQEQLINNKKSNLNSAIEDMNHILKEFNQSDDKTEILIKEKENLADKNTMINNDFNIQDNKELMPQMNPNMNFSGDGQPFSSFMNEESNNKRAKTPRIDSSAQDLAEEAAILSTMAENIAIANKNELLKETKVITDNEGVKKINTRTNIKIEEIVKYDSIIMNQADVEVFINLVEKGEADLKNLALNADEKSTQVSKTLADMLAKSMETNQPVRINFDNNISVIIRISREGKITADFLPSSQVAEAYLKENLPLLRQKFDDNNIDYELNQRERREQNKEDNKKKGRNNE